MNEIAKCPICGKYPMVWSAERMDITCKIECCDNTIATPIGVVEKWNQYAAAMELAKKLKELSQCDLNHEHYYIEKQVESAERRVLEVFK